MNTDVLIVTGMSGAGKRTALDFLRARGFTCTDNLPVTLAEAFATAAGGRRAAVVDARGGAIPAGWTSPHGATVIFLDAADAVLQRRLAESTTPHPVAAGNTPARIAAERETLQPLRASADIVIDTGALTAAQLGERLNALVGEDGSAPRPLTVTLSSFGFKYGAETAADWVIDARFLPNPFWVPELRPGTGLDAAVSAYVIDADETQEFLEHTVALLGWTLARYRAHGRHYLHVAVGCTGGRHRSVAVAEALARRLENEGTRVTTYHRDVERPDPR